MNLADACVVADIVRAAQAGQRVARLREGGEVTVGTARSIGDTRGMFARSDDDVMSLCMRVTTIGGWDEYWAVSDLIRQVRDGLTVLDYRSADR